MIDTLKCFGEVLEDVSLKEYNTYRIGGLAKCIIFPNSVEDLKELIKYLNSNNEKYMILGNGSNVIFSDNLYDGVIIKLDKLNNITIDDTKVTTCNLKKFSEKLNKRFLLWRLIF